MYQKHQIMKERILEAFGNLGFKLEDAGNGGYSFTYEGLNLLLLYNENDEDFLNIALPGIIEADDGKVLQICALMEKINSTLKYVKAYLFGDSVWMFYEREFLGGEDLPLVISRMILHLEAGLQFARKTIAEIENTVTNDSSDEKVEDAVEVAAAEELNDDGNNE